jgi:type IV secretory pathway VirB3-like protein
MPTTDTLFVACTRPTTKWGVPYDGLRVNAFVTLIVTTVIIKQPPGFLIGIAIHMGMRELCRLDPHFFHKWKLYYRTKMMSMMTSSLWGGSRLDPSPARIGKATEIRSSL